MNTLPAVLLVAAAVVVVFIMLLAWILLVGNAPRCMLRYFARCIRCLKGKRGKPGGAKFTYNLVFPGVVLGSLPHNSEEVLELQREHQIAGVITMNERWELPGKEVTTTVEEIGAAGLRTCWLPTPDYSAVWLSNMHEGADFVHEIVSKGDGQSCYVHCNGGRGRSTIIVLAYMIKYHGMTPQGAFAHVAERRKVARLRQLGGVRPQWRCVLNFYRELHGKRRVCCFQTRSGRVAPAGAAPTAGRDDVEA